MEDLKKESITIDSETGRVMIRSSREDSYERLLESGWQFETMESMEEQTIRSMVLKQALQKLTLEEQKLIEEIYFLQKTERQASDALHMAKTTLRRKHHKALKKLRKLLEGNF